jgi:hypothetical protein
MLGFSMLVREAGGAEFLGPARKATDAWLQLLDRQWKQQQQLKAAQTSAAAVALPPHGDDNNNNNNSNYYYTTVSTGESAEDHGSSSSQQAMYSRPAGIEVEDFDRFDRFIPVWDFDAPFLENMDGPRDTSAAAIAALGMLYLAEGEINSACAEQYLYAAVCTLRALASEKYLAAAGDDSFLALLQHATGGFPMQNHVDVGLISGDYYFLAALNKCRRMENCNSYIV